MKRDPEAGAIRSVISNMRKLSQERICNLIEDKLSPSPIQVGAATLYLDVENYDKKILLTNIWSAAYDHSTLYLLTHDGILYAFDTRDNAKLTIWISANRSPVLVQFVGELFASISYVWKLHRKDLLPTSIIKRHQMKKQGTYPEVRRY